ncbi:HTH_Tnp_Tc3_2 domain-containing protein [Trichonephila clavipes]|nr:HTH_Tnp_Tc3_2 domain-containing protein [Trichonephila clavipes]
MVELLDDWNVEVPSWKYPRNLESPRSVISRLWQRFQDDGNVDRCYSTGRPRVTTPNEDRLASILTGLESIEHVWDWRARQLPPTCLPELRRALLDELRSGGRGSRVEYRTVAWDTTACRAATLNLSRAETSSRWCGVNIYNPVHHKVSHGGLHRSKREAHIPKKRRITTQISMPSPGFEPSPYGISVGVANHSTVWAVT